MYVQMFKLIYLLTAGKPNISKESGTKPSSASSSLNVGDGPQLSKAELKKQRREKQV